MQIDRLVVKNFNGFENREFVFNSRFNLIVGDNATGKTSLLDALAVSIGSWFLGIHGIVKTPGIASDEVRVRAFQHADSFTFEKQFPARIESAGTVMGRPLVWVRELLREGGRTTSQDAAAISHAASEAEAAVGTGANVTLPLICTYGTERLWFEKSRRQTKSEGDRTKHPSRFDGYRECFDFTIQETTLIQWIGDQASVAPQLGKDPLALEVVKKAIGTCLEGASGLYYDGRYQDLVVLMDRPGPQLFRNLSDGQRIMLTMVGDLARRAVTLNPHLASAALEETPGVVLVDELDLHLHPRWQRRVISNLKTAFPSVQFITTTHSPQLIGEALPEEIRVLAEDQTTTPPRSFGIDSSRVLEEVMHAPARNQAVEDRLSSLAKSIDEEDFGRAGTILTEVEAQLGPSDPEVTKARALITFLESRE